MDWEESKFSSMQWAEGVWGDRWCAAAMLWTETVWTGSLTWKESLAGLRGAIGLSVLQKCMVDGSGLGVNSTGVWKRVGGVEEVVRECVCVCVCVYEPFYKVIVLYLFVLGYLVTQAFILLLLC